MPRGFQVDRQATLKRFGYVWRPGKSFVSQPKIIPGECDEPKGHLVLWGKDKSAIRAEIFRRNREANGGVNRCAKCGVIVYQESEDLVSLVRGEWNHIRHKAGERCDCPENGEVLCSGCHPKEHPQVQFAQSSLRRRKGTG